MSANPQRRRLLSLFAAAPLAAAAGVPVGPTGAGLLRRLSSGFASSFTDERLVGLGRFADALDRTELTLDTDPRERLAAVPDHLARLAASPDSNPASMPARQATEARAIAALALTFPPEIAAYRSFGAPMRRRLYAELLLRESARLSTEGEPPPTPPASPGPDA